MKAGYGTNDTLKHIVGDDEKRWTSILTKHLTWNLLARARRTDEIKNKF
jgi:hypothetical protein